METLNKQLSVAHQIFQIILMFQLFALQQYFQRQGIMPLFSKTHPAKQTKTKQHNPLRIIIAFKMIKGRI